MHDETHLPEGYAVSAARGLPEENASGVAWSAIFAGASASAALSLILIVLGTGLGFAAVSPWSADGSTAVALGVSAVVWLAFTQIIASGLGGYLAGRLRVKWAGVHGDEVYFRDTAHGFLSWALATLVVVVFLGTALGSIVAGGANLATQAATPAVAAVASEGARSMADDQGQSEQGPMTYFVDSLFRTEQPRATDMRQASSQATVIFANALRTGSLSEEDKTYVARLVSARTGLDEAQAQERVEQVYSQTTETIDSMQESAKAVADDARKVAASTALWMFVALLCGAFFASLMGIYGGRQRDAL